MKCQQQRDAKSLKVIRKGELCRGIVQLFIFIYLFNTPDARRVTILCAQMRITPGSLVSTDHSDYWLLFFGKLCAIK